MASDFSVNRNEALRYLSCYDGNISEDVQRIMDECEKEFVSAAAPRFIYRYFDVSVRDNRTELAGTGVALEGSSICGHLEGCSGVILLAATLGSGTDMLIRKMQVRDMAYAVVTDALASAAIEQVCSEAEEKIKSQYPEKYFTWRYSPGYGDFSLDIQKKLLDILDAGRRIGLCTSASNMLTPIKSITSVMGVSETPLPQSVRGCITCSMKDRCKFRRRGLHCGF